VRQFSDQHLAALAVMVLGGVLCVAAARRHPGRWLVPFARLLALVIFVGWAGEYVADVVQGIWSVRYTLPLQLTDAISITTILALWTRRVALVELAYLWAFTASLQAVLTPDLAWAFPSVFYFTYFIYHIGAIVGAGLLVYGFRIYPRAGAVLRVYGVTLAFTVIAGAADLLTGGNYMYLREKPAHASLVSVLGPWPWYIVSTAALGFVLLLAVAALTSAIRAWAEPDAPPREQQHGLPQPGAPLRFRS